MAVGGDELRWDFVLGQGFEAFDAGDDGLGEELAVGGGGDLAGFDGAGDEAALDEDGGDLGEADDGLAGVLSAAINLGDVAEEGVVDALREGEALDVGDVAGLLAEVVKGEGVIGGGGFAAGGDGVDLEAAGVGVGIIEMDGDEDAVGGGVGEGGALLEGDEGVIGAGHEDLEAIGFEELAGAEADVEGEVFFVAKDADGAFVMAAVAWIEDDGIDGIEAGDELRAEAGLDDL